MRSGMEGGTPGALRPSTRLGDIGVLSTDFDVPAAHMTAVNAGGVIARRVDVVAYESFCAFVEAGLEVDEDFPAAFMMAINSVGGIVHRVDVDTLQNEPDFVAGSGILRAFDSLSGCRRFAAHGGLLGRRIAPAKSKYGTQNRMPIEVCVLTTHTRYVGSKKPDSRQGIRWIPTKQTEDNKLSRCRRSS